ncbi:MAG: CoA ester lyase [Pseudomonadota bacterium]
MIRLRRTILYLPADKPRALQKAATLPADGFIIDLEDAVAPAGKDDARQAASKLLLEDAGKDVTLRINPQATPWYELDVAVARAADLDAIVLPKVRCAADVEKAAHATGHAVWPMIETPEGVLNAAPIAMAAAATGPAALILGTNDLAAELGVTPGANRQELSFSLQRCVLAARAAGIDAIDGVFNHLDDADGLTREAAAGRALGMAGKTVIHPRQIEPVNVAFSPSDEEVKEARRVVAAVKAAEASGAGVATLDGRMVEALHARSAAATIARADTIRLRQNP